MTKSWSLRVKKPRACLNRDVHYNNVVARGFGWCTMMGRIALKCRRFRAAFAESRVKTFRSIPPPTTALEKDATEAHKYFPSHKIGTAVEQSKWASLATTATSLEFTAETEIAGSCRTAYRPARRLGYYCSWSECITETIGIWRDHDWIDVNACIRQADVGDVENCVDSEDTRYAVRHNLHNSLGLIQVESKHFRVARIHGFFENLDCIWSSSHLQNAAGLSLFDGNPFRRLRESFALHIRSFCCTQDVKQNDASGVRQQVPMQLQITSKYKQERWFPSNLTFWRCD